MLCRACCLVGAAGYFQVPLSHCVPAMPSHVIRVLLVSLLPAVGPHLLPATAVALCLGAVIPRHEKPPSLAEAGPSGLTELAVVA